MREPIAGGFRSRISAGALVVGAVSALCSAAWGCQVLVGKMTATGNAGTGVVTTIGDGNQNDFGWCPGYPMGKAKATRGGTVTITVSKAGALACGDGPTRLSPGTYDVNYINGRVFTRSDKTDKDNTDGSRQWTKHCLSGGGGLLGNVLPDDNPDDDLVRIGSLTVNEFGKGSGTYRIPSSGVVSGPTDEAGVCVSTPRGSEGNQVPLTIV